MTPGDPGEHWQVKILHPRLPWDEHPVRPAEVASGLCGLLLKRENLLEDVNYSKIVPNHFIVEVGRENYTHHYQPIANRIVQQWIGKLLEHLATANSRIGRKEFRFGGRVQIEIRPVGDLRENQVRILSQIDPADALSAAGPRELPACLVMSPGGLLLRLRPGVTTIGRDPGCDIHLDIPGIQERRLVSGLHAHIRSDNGQYRLFDGSPDGKPSLNGTYVGYRRVPLGGVPLQEGDFVILAALDPEHPTPDTPGVVTFRFRLDCTK